MTHKTVSVTVAFIMLVLFLCCKNSFSNERNGEDYNTQMYFHEVLFVHRGRQKFDTVRSHRIRAPTLPNLSFKLDLLAEFCGREERNLCWKFRWFFEKYCDRITNNVFPLMYAKRVSLSQSSSEWRLPVFPWTIEDQFSSRRPWW